MPEVSVIIPNYNHAHYLEQRINSVLSQSYTDFEVIILDDRSTDNSRDIIEGYRNDKRISKIIFNDINSGGPFGQWEKGITAATGKWVWIAESDDYASSEFLDTLLKLAKRHAGAGIIFAGSHWVDDNGEIKDDLSVHKQSFYRAGTEEIKRFMCWQCSIQNASSAIIRRDLAAGAIRGLSGYRACGDWIFYTRILHYAGLVHTSNKLNYFRWYHNNISNAAKSKGYWLTEGIQVLNNIDIKNVKFNVWEFTRMAKFWSGMIWRSQGSPKKELNVLMNMVMRYLGLTKAAPHE
ncbi:glycosyltransferase family 2 protein [Mucilaginibacter hurinus]|uniref:Glycosyltransferase family 2 protein n=1 Tax=Mucilaginibacter hurinus TaxID=2201324 RepID=A0A367GQE2_9SPHI|nr:glycosyltransferase family 2 protein [Mucilaginibacter hurinus]RCH55490.1 glycosyltransferase family 2 protein [Mucilaginibacter hurinus]